MLNKIIEFSVKQKLIIGLLILALIGYGCYEVTQLPIDAVPDITNNQVQIITSAPSLGATDIERLITFPIEQANSNIHGLIELRSFSRFGLSVVTLIFDDGTDVYWARQQVQERLQNVKDQIPAGVGTPSMGPITTGLGEIYQYVVKTKKGYESRYDETELRTIQDWIVRRDLLRVEGIADVSSFGGKLKQYEIAINTDKLNAFGVSLDEVFAAVQKNNENTGGAYIEKNASVLFIRTEGLLKSKEDIENIAIHTTEAGYPLLIKDVADVKIGHAIRYGGLTFNGEGEVAGAIVMMVKGGNSSKIIKDVKEKISEIQKTLPEGVEIVPFLDRTKMVNNAIKTVETNLLEGALIVLFILVLFLGNLRAGLLVASVIPLAMLFAIILMNVFGVSGNLMSLGALDFGLIIDGAVIIVEATMHQLQHSKRYRNITKFNQLEMDGVVKESAGKMMNSAVFGQIIILVVYLPIFTLQGIEGKMFKPMAQTVAFALIGAFILSLTYVPMMSALILSKKIKNKDSLSDRLMFALEKLYQKVLGRVLEIPKTILSATIALFVLSIFVLSTLGGEFIPALEEGDFAVETRVLTGTSLKSSMDACLKAEKLLLSSFPEVIKVVGKTGSGEIPTDPMPIEATDLMIILKDKKEWTSAKSFDELAEKMQKKLEDIPGVTFGFQYPVQMRFNELMTGARQDVVCKIYGEDLDSLALYASKLGKIVNTIQGASDVYVEAVTGMPQIVIHYNRLLLTQYGLTIEDVNRCVNASFSGYNAGLIYEGEKRFDLVVRLDTNKRSDVTDVQNLLINTPNGDQIPLQTVADIGIEVGPNQIQRENTKRRIVVGFNVRGRDVQSMVEELKSKTESNIHFQPGYKIEYGGSFKNLEKAKKRLSIAVPVALALIFLLLFFAFKSIKQGLIIFSAIPLSAIGGILALAVLDLPFSISAGIGFIALFGVAVLNGIVLIAEFNRIKSEGVHDLKRIVLMGTKIRMRPVLMTAFVASLGFLPMALSHGAGAEVQRPLASVVIGGLLIATFLTLFVLPILYVVSSSKPQIKVGTSMVTVLLLLVTFTSFSQKEIGVKEAYELALSNNLLLKNERLKVDYQKAFVNTVTPFSSTSIQGDYGRLNSYYFDNNVSISQGVDFPSVYQSKKRLAFQEWEKSVFQLNLQKCELKKQLSEVYFTIVNLQNKEKLLVRIDSIYGNYLQKVALKIKYGESNILEKTTIENQRLQIAHQLKQLRNDLYILSLQFNLQINATDSYIPRFTETKIDIIESIIDSSIQNHPSLLLYVLDLDKAMQEMKLEKSKLSPSFTFGMSSGTMYGTGSNDVDYTYSTRFNTFSASINFPLLSRQNKFIKSAKIKTEIAKGEYAIAEQKLKNHFLNTVNQLKAHQEIVNELEETALSNSEQIFHIADKQLVNGDISYMEWAMLINQSISIQSNYQDALLQLNKTKIELIYLLSK
jgi:cobalt-zinc-cadmium resistance protein CzcA